MTRYLLVCSLLLAAACAVESPALPAPEDPHGVVPIGDFEFSVSGALVDDVAADPDVLGARLVPTWRDGVPLGYKTYAIADDGPLHEAGFLPGDTIIAINDVPLTSPAAASAALAEVRANAYATVDLIRSGEVLAVHFWVE